MHAHTCIHVHTRILHTHAHAHTHAQFYPDRAVQRDVMDVFVKCVYQNTGCPWTGQLKNWEVRREGRRREWREWCYVEGFLMYSSITDTTSTCIMLCLSLPQLFPILSLPPSIMHAPTLFSHRTTLMNVFSVQSSVPIRNVKWCYHSTNWSHTSRPASSGE